MVSTFCHQQLQPKASSNLVVLRWLPLPIKTKGFLVHDQLKRKKNTSALTAQQNSIVLDSLGHLGYMSVPKPITVTKGMQCTGWLMPKFLNTDKRSWIFIIALDVLNLDNWINCIAATLSVRDAQMLGG